MSSPTSPPLNGISRLSLDGASPRTSLSLSPNHSNGVNAVNGDSDINESVGGREGGNEREKELEKELERIRGERNNYENQYRGLLGKLTNMRNTLGDKLKQDADELDRRAVQITSLTSEISTLNSTISTLQSELLLQTTDTSTLSSDLSLLRSRLSASEGVQADLEDRLENERRLKEEWEEEAMKEKVRREEVERRLKGLEEESERCRRDMERWKGEAERSKEECEDLARVLEEFQAGKDRELETMVGSVKIQLEEATKALMDYKKRAAAAESRLTAVHTDSEKSMALAKELKEKNMVIGKLRHDAVIMNEHLTEAMRRLKRDNTDHNVDRRLVTNVLITFLRTPRADTKRYEMLQLLASVLGWGDEEREKAGLQKAVGGDVRPATSTGRIGRVKEDMTADNESFSNLFVEFLLREAGQAAPSTTSDKSSKGGPLPSSISTPLFSPAPPSASTSTYPQNPPFSPPPPSAKFKLPEIPPFNPDRAKRGVH